MTDFEWTSHKLSFVLYLTKEILLWSEQSDYRLFPSLLTRHINNWNDAETVHTRIWSKWNFHGPNKYSWDRFFWSFTLFDFNAHQTFWESDVCYRVHSYEFVLHIIWYVDYIYILYYIYLYNTVIIIMIIIIYNNNIYNYITHYYVIYIYIYCHIIYILIYCNIIYIYILSYVIYITYYIIYTICIHTYEHTGTRH